MPIRFYQPCTLSLCFKSSLFFKYLLPSKPKKPFTKDKKGCSDQNNEGLITVKGRGGGYKKILKIKFLAKTKKCIFKLFRF